MNTETVQYTMRIPTDLKTDLERIAKGQDRSLSKQIIYALRQFVRDTDGAPKPPVA